MYLMSVSWFVSPRGGHVNRAAAKHHGDPVRDLQDLREVVADIDDADAVSGEVAGVINHPLALHDGERRGRLVQQHHLRLPVDRARDGDRLALPAGEARDRARLGGNLAANLPQQIRGFAADRPVVDIGQKARAGDAPARARERCWRRPRDRRPAPGPDRRSRCRARAPRAASSRSSGSPASSIWPRIRPVDAGDVLDQGRFAGAVVADERQDLSGVKLEIDATQRLDRTEALAEL